jgi:hypothetical protein
MKIISLITCHLILFQDIRPKKRLYQRTDFTPPQPTRGFLNSLRSLILMERRCVGYEKCNGIAIWSS